ncbi:MAG: peroxidase [Pseudomonadota bacterium]
MTKQLNLEDIQGNVIRAYGKFGYPKARYFFLNLTNAWVGRRFVKKILDQGIVTTAQRWVRVPDPLNPGKTVPFGPDITMNMGFSFMGLYLMELPTRTLQGMPDEFIDGMRKRAFILGDKPAEDIQPHQQPVMDSAVKEMLFKKEFGEAPMPELPSDDPPAWMGEWDPIWQENRSRIGSTDVHIWISINAKVDFGTETPVTQMGAKKNVLEDYTDRIQKACEEATAEYLERFKDPRGQIKVLTACQVPDEKSGKKVDSPFIPGSAVFEDIVLDQDLEIPIVAPVEKDGVWVPEIVDRKKHKKGEEVRLPTPYEHFEMSDGIGDPVFEGQFPDAEMAAKVKGRGKWMSPDREWEPLATGEFLLGHPDESQELPPAARPPEFSNNGTFMAFRKLHENVGSFFGYIKSQAKAYANSTQGSEEELDPENPEHLERAEIILKSKIVGRWPDGISMTQAPTWKAWVETKRRFSITEENTYSAWVQRINYLRNPHASDFKFGDDIQGYKNPNASHLRRVNTRDYLDPLNEMHPETYKDEYGKPNPRINQNATTQLNKRRRILRRGLPYGDSNLYDKGTKTDETEQGVAMMIICANLFRQFEFVQQQWIEYGLDFNSGNNTCPLVGNHDKHNRFTVPADPAKGGCPFIMAGMPTFVEPRGGEYFFIPSMTALRMIANGSVDPT